VLTADHAAADQCNVQIFHDEFLLKSDKFVLCSCLRYLWFVLLHAACSKFCVHCSFLRSR
jgi:hypothetical protein